ncbi:MAG: glutamate--tRNA ligase family protein, partial [Saprospiraceae bacterium]
MSLGTEFLAFARTLGPDSRLRLAPTPSGYLHRGNALNFTLNWLATRLQPGANLLLRIDDLDADRKRPEYVADIFESLHWLGVDWEEGPASVDDFEKNWSQNLRKSLYHKALADLRSTGLLYACAKSRQDMAPYGGHYPLEFRNQYLDLDAPHVAWRIATPAGFPLPDFIVRRRDGVPAYQVASMVDDLHFGVTHIIRGVDLATSTYAQRWLAEQLDWPD